MSMPSSREARLFYRAAYQRMEDAELLLSWGRTTAAVYLAGYCVECILKALILASVPDAEQFVVAGTFRGQRAHDFDWLKYQYVTLSGQGIPPHVNRPLTRVNTWTTDMRYLPGTTKVREAEDFLRDAAQILAWADGRL